MGEDPSALRHDVEEARAHLGDTVDALAFKASAPRRAAAQLRTNVSPALAAAVGAACLLAVGLLVRRRVGR